MNTIEVKYAGLTLRNPIIIGSSGLTNSATKVKELERAGAGAVVLKSLFEEQILMDTERLLKPDDYPEALDYISTYVKSNTLKQYLDLIKESKANCTIPVIASINCYQSDSWAPFAKDIEEAGADALEINIFRIATDVDERAGQYEQLHIDILRKVKEVINIPVIIKLGQRFSNIVSMVNDLKANGAAAVVLFNRFYQPDIDIAKLQFVSGPVFSTSAEFSNTLRWLGITSGQIPNLDIAASTGIHDPESVVKALLAGATAVEVCSAVYLQGAGLIQHLTTYLEEWMFNKGYTRVDEFKGLLNFKNVEDQSVYERVQFMKYFSNRD